MKVCACIYFAFLFYYMATKPTPSLNEKSY